MKFLKNPIVYLLLLVSTTQAQYSISGKITEKQTGKPLSRANIVLKGTFLATTSQSDGSYQLTNVKPGTFKLKVSYVGFQEELKEINVTKDTEVSFSLEPNIIIQDEVIVRATRLGNETPTNSTFLDGEAIQKENDARDIPFLINLTPSLVISSDAGTGIGYTSMRLRGVDPSRINVTLNGIPLNDAESQSVFWVNMPDLASSVDNIQIQRGVGTSTNGSAAFGGSINIKTNSMNTNPYGSLRSSAGSFRTFRNTLEFGTGLIKGRWTIDGRLSKITSNGYIDRGFSDLKSFHISSGYFSEKTLIRLNILSGKEKTYQSWAGVPKDSLQTNRTYNPFTYENQTDNYQQDHYQAFISQILHPEVVFNLGLHYTYGRGYYEEYQDQSDPYAATSLSYYGLDTIFLGGDTVTNTDLIRQKWLDNDFYGITWSLNYKPASWEIILGGSWNTYLGRAFGEIIWARYSSNSFKGDRWYENSGNKRDYNIFTKAKYNLNNRLSFFGDIQFRFIDYKINGTEDAFGDVTQSHYFRFLNPKAGMEFKSGKRNRSFFSFAIANREPSRQNYIDASADGIVPGCEKLYDLELGHEYRTSEYILMGNLYYMHYKDQLVATGEIDNVGYPILRNVPESYRAGIELIAGLKLLNNLNWNLNATFSRNRIRDFSESVDNLDSGTKINIKHGETEISFSPCVIAGSIFTYEPFKGFKTELSSKYVSRQYIDNTESKERSLDPYFVNNLRFTYSFNPGLLEHIRISFEVLNLLNEEYETNAWVYKYYYGGRYYTSDGYFPQAGIHFMGGVEINL